MHYAIDGEAGNLWRGLWCAWGGAWRKWCYVDGVLSYVEVWAKYVAEHIGMWEVVGQVTY